MTNIINNHGDSINDKISFLDSMQLVVCAPFQIKCCHGYYSTYRLNFCRQSLIKFSPPTLAFNFINLQKRASALERWNFSIENQSSWSVWTFRNQPECATAQTYIVSSHFLRASPSNPCGREAYFTADTQRTSLSDDRKPNFQAEAPAW